MPIINNKLAQIIIGIKYEYNTVNRTFTLRSSGRNDKTHCQSLHSLVLFIARSKRDKKIKLNWVNRKEVPFHWSNAFLKLTVKTLKQKFIWKP